LHIIAKRGWVVNIIGASFLEELRVEYGSPFGIMVVMEIGKKFEVIDHTADIGIAAYGADLKEAFANAAYGLFSLMVDLEGVGDDSCYQVEVTAEDRSELLVAWLNELIYLFEVESVLFKRFEISGLVETRLRAMCYGEKIDPQRHGIKVGVKAATYHMLRVEGESEKGFRVQVLFDI
jgi:SHS2 domain-containing protein